MKKEQIIELMKLMPTYPPQVGYFFRASQHGLGLVEEAKKIAKEVWKQEFCVIFTDQIDALDLLALCEHHKDKAVTYIFSNMDKAMPKFREKIYEHFHYNRNEYLHPLSHVIYIVNPDEDEYYSNPCNDYVMLHSMEILVEA